MSSDNSLNHISTSTDVPITVDKILPFDELVHRPCFVKPISQKRLEQTAVENAIAAVEDYFLRCSGRIFMFQEKVTKQT